MDKESWLGMGNLLRASLPDIDYIFENIREQEDGVLVTGYFAGTFSNDFDLSFMGMGVIPASGKKIRWPSATSRVTIEDGQITRSHALSADGLAAFFEPLSAS
jgi:hypothetical protein